jgi:LDH2 family malate/lactate/ureidoglycolate dehydrogenase
MNQPPEDSIRVPHKQLRDFVVTAATTVGLPDDKASLLADLLSRNDLRGIFSHGTQQIATYALLMRDGKLNNQPDVTLVQETASSVLVDGDGGLGYFPAYEGTRRLIDKAKETGIAVMASRNHGHFGAAGMYARMPLEHDLLTFVTSGVQLHLKPGDPLHAAAGGSPMAFSAPANQEESLVLDFGAIHDLYPSDPHRDEIASLAPGLVLRCIGMGEICQSWGGLLSGLPMQPKPPRWQWPGANQGSLVITFRIDLFLDPGEFKTQMDDYVRAVRDLSPLDGFEATYMPGGIEAARETSYREEGVPVGTWHRERLEGVAEELGLQAPW